MKNTTYGKRYGKKSAKPAVKNNVPKGPRMPKEWLYLAEDEITPAQIYGLFAEEKSWKAEYWEEAEVVEIELPEAGSVDMENLGGAAGLAAALASLAGLVTSVFAAAAGTADLAGAACALPIVTNGLIPSMALAFNPALESSSTDL